MLEIYKSHINTMNGRQVTDLQKVDQIAPECWIALTAPTEDELKIVEEALDISPDFLRYPLDEEEIPRLDYEADNEQILIIADFPVIRHEANNTKYETQPIGIILVKKCVVTIELRETGILDPFKNNRVRDFITAYRTRFVFQIMYAGAKEYLKLLRFMDKTIDTVERQLNKAVSNRELFKLMELGKSLVYFSTSLKSNDSVLEKMMRSRYLKQYEEDQDLLEDVIVEYRQALEMADIYASIINGMMDAYASIISNNLNVVMKFMAAMTIVLAVPQVVYSFFGQNVIFPFDGAFYKDPWPFLITIIISVAATTLTIWWLNKKDMF